MLGLPVTDKDETMKHKTTHFLKSDLSIYLEVTLHRRLVNFLANVSLVPTKSINNQHLTTIKESFRFAKNIKAS